jgi:serine/threonine protein kinase
MDALTTVTDLTELFDFQNRIDAGGMGQTHLVRCKRDRGALRAGCDYVLKEVRADLVRDARAFEPTPPGGTVPSGRQTGSVAAARFAREADIGLALDHPHIVPVYWYGTVPATDQSGAPYLRQCIVMKHLLGGTLEDRLDVYFADPKRAARVTRHIADALHYMHERGIVHHDLKTTNAMLAERDDDDSVALIDFGLARHTDNRDKLTATTDRPGTVKYMAPEYLNDTAPARAPKASHDVFAVGVILYRLVTRAYPFDGPTREVIVRAIDTGKYKSPAQLNRKVDRELEALVAHCLARDPHARYASAAELRANLDRYLSGERVEDPVQRRDRTLFNCGRMDLSLYVLIGGDGTTRYTRDEEIEAEHRATAFALPPVVAAGSEQRTEQKQRTAAERGAPFFDGKQMRVLGVSWGTTDDAAEAPLPLLLVTENCSYYQTMLTNGDHGFALPDGRTVREACAASDPYEFATCQLANPICVNLSVVSADNYVFYCERGTRVGMNPGGFQPAVSGTGNPDLDVRAGRYDPWETALREATQEFVGAVKVPRASVAFFGFARLHHNRCPFLFGELRLPLTRDAIFSIQVQDRYETRQRRAVPLEPGPVAEACREMYGLRDAKGAPSVQAHSTIFSLVMSLLYADPTRYYSEFVPAV